MTDVLLIGGGYANCCMARLLNEIGMTSTIVEKSGELGGMAKTFYKDGMAYEYGPHILANHHCDEEVIKFITRFVRVLPTTIDTASYFNNRFNHYPPQKEDVTEKLPTKVDETNFETYLVSKVGKKLYQEYYENFTRKFWDVEPSSLSADWAKIRHLGEFGKKMFFNNVWCAYPVADYNELFTNLTTIAAVELNTEIHRIDLTPGQLTVSSISLDKLFNYKYGELQYGGYEIEAEVIEQDSYLPGTFGIVYYPENDVPYTRITEYKKFNHKKHPGRTLITREYPSKRSKFYPFHDKVNEERFTQYLREVSNYSHIITLGRLGLYKYTTMDTTTAMAVRLLKYIPDWMHLTPEKRFEAYLDVRGGWHE